MLTDLLKWGKRGDAPGRGDTPARDEPAVASKAFPKFLAAIAQRDSPVLLDLGPVIGSNVYQTRIERHVVTAARRRLTKEDAGEDAAAWREWMRKNPGKPVAAK